MIQLDGAHQGRHQSHTGLDSKVHSARAYSLLCHTFRSASGLPNSRQPDFFSAAKHSETVQEPKNYRDNNHDVEDRLELSVHGNVLVDEPKQYPDDY